MVHLLRDAETNAKDKGEPGDLTLRMQREYYELCQQDDDFQTSDAANITEFTAEASQNAKVDEKFMWDVPDALRRIIDWPGSPLHVQVFGPDYVRCPVWVQPLGRIHISKSARHKPQAEHADFIAEEIERYSIPEGHTVDVFPTWPIGVEQHYECLCPDLKGDNGGAIYLPWSQLREPTVEEKSDPANAAFFGSEDPDLASSYAPTLSSPVRSSGYARHPNDVGSFYNPPTPLRSDVFDRYEEDLEERDFDDLES